MADSFCMKGKDDWGNTQYIDLPGGTCAEGVEVTAYPQFHAGPNQKWKWDDGHILTSLSDQYCLAVREIRDGANVFLHQKGQSSLNVYYKWTFQNGVIKLENNFDFCLGISGNNITLRRLYGNCLTNWELEIVRNTVKPASSCHLHYQSIPIDKIANSWTIENTVCVRHTADCTYFCVIGWGPGGYSGIQQIDENHRVAIFSMWNDGTNSVREIEHGDGVSVTSFGGEGTGMKAMKEVNWQPDQKITFRVAGVKYNNHNNQTVWRCSCWFEVENRGWQFMCAYERTGPHPFNQFYSFVEDWKREHNCEGHAIRRSVEFTQPKLITGNGEVNNLRQAIFTKQSNGADEYGQGKAFGGVGVTSSCFLLSTGGSTEEQLVQDLRGEGCQQFCSNTLTTFNM